MREAPDLSFVITTFSFDFFMQCGEKKVLSLDPSSKAVSPSVPIWDHNRHKWLFRSIITIVRPRNNLNQRLGQVIPIPGSPA